MPYRSDARLRLADSYFALKKFADAVRVYGRMAGDGDDYALYQIGQAYSNAGDAFEAISTFRRLLDEYPVSEWRQEAQYSLGYLYFLNQDFEQAIGAYNLLIEDYPRDPLAAKAQYGIGDALFNAEDLNGAVRAYEQVLRKFPNSPFTADAAAGIQFALLALGDEDRGDAIVDSFAVSNPDSPVIDQLLFRRAEVKYQSGQVVEALAEFQRFIRNARQETLLPEAYYYLGSIYAEKGAVIEASSYFGQLIERYPDSPRFAESARRLGHLYLQTGEFAEAERIFDLMESHHEDDAGVIAEARYGKSLALNALGRSEEAEFLLRDAIQAAPDSDESTPAYLGLARLHLERGELEEADRLFELVVRRSRDETGAEALYLLGDMALEHVSPQAAVETLGRMSTLYAGYPEWMAQAYLTQAEAFEQMGDPGEAVLLYDLILSTYPDSPWSEIAIREKARLER
ncbi:MAG: tetratricopeptide repeat protein [Bacteroidetes bacterium]|nr:tetratricopeptide repeat protein [Bacteroidota bacterium]